MHQKFAVGILALSLVLSAVVAGAAPQEEEPDPQALERSREIVQMLDDIYKNAIVLITDKYVNEPGDFPAGSAAIELFRRISEKGFHNVRLIDVSGKPYSQDNVAENDFEKDAVEALRSGEDYVENVVEQNGEAYLEAATAVPVVMEKCVMCHPHYEQAKENDQIVGAIVYKVPIR